MPGAQEVAQMPGAQEVSPPILLRLRHYEKSNIGSWQKLPTQAVLQEEGQ